MGSRITRQPSPPSAAAQGGCNVSSAPVPANAGEQENIHPDVDGTDPNVAATKIQAGFRGYRTRKTLKDDNTMKSPPQQSKPPDMPTESAAVKIQANYRGYRVRKQLTMGDAPHRQQTELSHSPVDPHHVGEEHAATVIQAVYRGYHTRKQLKSHSSVDSPSYTLERNDDVERATQDAAATKIQASFRGYQTRHKLNTQKPKHMESAPDPQLAPEKADESARKIQAVFRGYRVRKTQHTEAH